MSEVAPTRWIAVTGASGFIGKHVLTALRARGVGIVALGRRPLQEASDLRWVSFDLAAPGNRELEALGSVDALVHLAWEGLPNYRARRHLDDELPRQCAFLDAVLSARVRRIVVTGTCFEYGMREGELHESFEPAPANPYGQAKDALRRHAEAACARHGCDLAWARLFYLFGDGQAPTSVWRQLSDHVRRGEKVFPMSGGQQVRDFLPIESAAEMLVRIAQTRHANGVMNICSGRAQTLEQTVRGWISERDWDIQLELGRFPYPDHEPFAFWGSRSRLDEVLASP
jgi:dTDP-6-deoxy-L-talose 4-dehydrogenase (NAD+)